MRTPGSLGGFYASMSRYYDHRNGRAEYEQQQASLFSETRAGRFFRLCYKKWPSMGINGTGIVEDVVCLILDGSKLLSPTSSFTDAVKITSIWVEHSSRSKGIGRDVLEQLTAIADKSGCVLLAVSNPFDFPETFSAKDALADSRKSDFDTKMQYVQYGFRKRQARMNGVLKSLGFRSIDITEYFENTKRCRVQDSWAYVPANYARYLDWGQRGLSERLKK